jgi:hypothetical protein
MTRRRKQPVRAFDPNPFFVTALRAPRFTAHNAKPTWTIHGITVALLLGHTAKQRS